MLLPTFARPNDIPSVFINVKMVRLSHLLAVSSFQSKMCEAAAEQSKADNEPLAPVEAVRFVRFFGEKNKLCKKIFSLQKNSEYMLKTIHNWITLNTNPAYQTGADNDGVDGSKRGVALLMRGQEIKVR